MTDTAQSPTKPHDRMPSILVVDDDPENLALMSAFLEGSHYRTLVAEDGESGVKTAEYASPSLILLDILMPGIDGFETCRRLKALESTRDIPVIFMTALAEAEHKVKGLSAGAVDYISKPFQREEVLARVGVHLRIRELTHGLKEAKELLEKRVEERTAELARANRELELEIKERKRAEMALQKAHDELELRVTERTAELMKMNMELEQSNQALEDFASIAAHDLQEPLRKILTFSDRLAARCKEIIDEKALDFLERMQCATRRMRDLIQALLDYSRVTRRREPFVFVNLNILLQEVVSGMQICLAETEGTVEVGDLPEVEADTSQMRELFQHLIGNALKYRHPLRLPVVRIRALPCEEGFVRIEVEDNGIGFDEEHLGLIFIPFEQLHSQKTYGGTGMGLAICKRIVERHSGIITAKSKKGEGSTFIITLPATQS